MVSSMPTQPPPIIVVGLLPGERRALLGLLDALDPDGWSQRTTAGDWTVKDVAAHLIADDLGRLSSQRDGHREPWDAESEPLKAYIDRRNADWVAATHRLSAPVVRSLLELGGEQTQQLFESLDPFELGAPVAWASPDPAPVWLDVARELTERWHHQQQIREAIGAPLLTDQAFMAPVLATFAFALVSPYRGVDAPAGTAVQLTVHGPSGGEWCVVRSEDSWGLRVGPAATPVASVSMDEETAWRMYVRALHRDEVERRSRIAGDERLGARMLHAFALVA